jgi:anti-anti-sigma factor
MEIQWSHSGAVSVATLTGRMDAVSAQMFEQQAGQLTGKAVRLVLDLAKLEYISSVGLRSLLAAAKKIQASGGSLCLCGLQGLVKDILECSNFTSLFPVFRTVAEATA